jgi:hypothetical protein
MASTEKLVEEFKAMMVRLSLFNSLLRNAFQDAKHTDITSRLCKTESHKWNSGVFDNMLFSVKAALVSLFLALCIRAELLVWSDPSPFLDAFDPLSNQDKSICTTPQCFQFVPDVVAKAYFHSRQ